MKFDNCRVFNFEGALRGMRNPKNSWNLSDSQFGFQRDEERDDYIEDVATAWAEYNGYDWESTEYNKAYEMAMKWLSENGILNTDVDEDISEYAYIGPKDMRLARSLILGGSEHRKFLRQIFVTIDITAPLYWWKEMDTYKVSTVANSCSTMHKLANCPIDYDNFEMDDFEEDIEPYEGNPLNPGTSIKTIWDNLIADCENLRRRYNETKDIKYWKELVRLLPESWLQKRTWTADYETLRSIYHQRKNHKLTEWHQFCEFLETLPYAKELIIE